MSKETKEFCITMILVTLFFVAVFAWEASWQTPDNVRHYDEEPRYLSLTPTASPTPPETTEMPLEATESPRKTTEAPQATESPTPTPEPTEKALRASYGAGKPGRYLAEVNGKHGFKPFTSYTCYNDKSKPQYYLQKVAFNCTNGIRVVTDPNGVDRYCIALGTSWAGGSPSDIGRCVNIVMANGSLLPCVLADVKRVEDTVGCLGYYGATNNDCLEFIVSQRMFQDFTHGSWDCSAAGAEFRGDVAEVIVLDYFIEGFGKE